MREPIDSGDDSAQSERDEAELWPDTQNLGAYRTACAHDDHQEHTNRASGRERRYGPPLPLVAGAEATDSTNPNPSS